MESCKLFYQVCGEYTHHTTTHSNSNRPVVLHCISKRIRKNVASVRIAKKGWWRAASVGTLVPAAAAVLWQPPAPADLQTAADLSNTHTSPGSTFGTELHHFLLLPLLLLLPPAGGAAAAVTTSSGWVKAEQGSPFGDITLRPGRLM
jgi:hypothetical protein